MKPSRAFIKIGGICALLTALTTLAVHWLPKLWEANDSFEASLQLRNNPIYLTRLWVVLLHCILVVISMSAIAALKWRESPALVGFGLLGFVFFALFEIVRTALSIFALNRTWRAGYAAATDPETQRWLRDLISAYGGINNALFFLFDTAFVIGLFCYGFVLIHGRALDRQLGFLFLFWFVVSLPALIGVAVGNESLSGRFDWVGLYFIPIARALTGVWLWQKSSQLATSSPIISQ